MHPTQRARRWFLVGVVPFTAACGAERGSIGDNRTVTDSAGVEVVRLRLDPDALPEATLEVAPEITIGVTTGPGALELAGVIGALRLLDGSIVVANGATHELRFFAPDGTPLRVAGGRGEGPGEFASVGWLGRTEGDTILVYDDRLQRISRWGAAGDLLGAQPLTGAVLPHVAGSVAPGTLAAWHFVGAEDERIGVHAPEVAVGLVELVDGAFRAIAAVSGPEEARVHYRDRVTRAFRPFGRASDVAAGADFVYVLDSSNDRSIHVYDRRGSLRRTVIVEVPQRRSDAGLVDAWVESWIARFSTGSPELEAWWRHGFAATAPPEQVPLFRSLEVDGRGNVCAERYPLEWTATPNYWCFSPDGHPVGALRLPAGLMRRGPHPHFDPQLEISTQHVLGVWEGELGTEQVRQYRIAW